MRSLKWDVLLMLQFKANKNAIEKIQIFKNLAKRLYHCCARLNLYVFVGNVDVITENGKVFENK